MDETFDFVIVGSGGGGLCAALFMGSLGKSVVVLEKDAVVGGTTARAGGVMWIPNNRFLAKDGVKDSPEGAVAYMDAVVGDSADTPGASRARRLAYIEEAPKMLEFLIGKGLSFRRAPYWPDYYYGEAPGAVEAGRCVVAEPFDLKRLGDWAAKLAPGIMPMPAHLHEAMLLPSMKRSGEARKTLVKVMLRTIVSRLKGQKLVGAGGALQGQALAAALGAGADIRVSSPVKQIVIEDGRAVGVIVDKDGQDHRITARLGVLINAGGFSRNQRMLDQYAPGASSAWTSAGPGDTGEMIEEAQRVGAAVAQMDVRLGSEIALPPNAGDGMKPTVQNDIAKPHSLVVDQAGQRYMGESGSYMDVCRAMRERHKTTPAVPSWLVMDSQFIALYMLAGTMPGPKKPLAWIDSGFLKKADTLGGLAEACGIPPATLEATVERFNGFARAGKDEDFHRGDRLYERWMGDPLHKPSPTLGPVETGPFYAIQFYPGDVGTMGGLVTDVNARVLKADGTPIAGLYATGTSTASVMGRTSTGAGSSIGPSYTWGYVAAKHAANADNLAGAAQEAGVSA